MTPLFRPEAVRAQQQLWLGRVQIARPLPLTWLTAGVVGLAIVTAVFLSLAEYTRKAQAVGLLAPDRGVIRLVPAAPGTVVERHVIEGQTVRAGEVLFVLALDADTRDDASQDTLRRSVAERGRSLDEAARQQRALADSRQSTLARRLEALDGEQARLDAELALHRRRLELAVESQARLRALQSQSFISPAQLQAKDEEVLGLQAQGQALERQRAALDRDRAEIDGERRQVPLQLSAALGEIERGQAELAREGAVQQGVRRITVRALQDGTVGAVLAEPGQSVAAPAALATLVPAGSTLNAQLFAPSRAIGFVKPGQAVRLRFEAFPYQKYGHRDGRVVQVSRTPLSATELATLGGVGGGGGEPLFRITVALDEATGAQAALPLSAGMRLSADLMLERRRLVEWLFEPLLGLEARL